jgi:hypothetical protein
MMEEYKAGDFVPELGIDGLCRAGAEAYNRAFEVAGQHQGALLALPAITLTAYALSGIASGQIPGGPELAPGNYADYLNSPQGQKEIERMMDADSDLSFDRHMREEYDTFIAPFIVISFLSLATGAYHLLKKKE